MAGRVFLAVRAHGSLRVGDREGSRPRPDWVSWPDAGKSATMLPGMGLTHQDLQELVRLLEADPQLRGALRAALWKQEDVKDWLRHFLPRLLQEDPRFGAEVVGILAQTLSPRSELVRVLEEIASLREDFGRRFEAMDRRFEAMDRRFEALQREMAERFEAVDRRFEAAERRFEAIERTLAQHSRTLAEHSRVLRALLIGQGTLGRRFGRGLEEAVRLTVEEFAGLGPLRAERLVLQDDGGEVFGVPGQAIEFDAFVHDGRRFLVEVKAYAEPEDVLTFHRKLEFAAKVLGEPFERVLVAPFADRRAVELAQQLGIQVLGREGEGLDS